jgi:hypothetical protein
MSFSGVGGGFQGGDALLAFAAIQQGRMNEEMTESMRVADLRSQMSGDLADIKAHIDSANKHPEKFPEVAQELKAFMAKYGDEPALEDITSSVGDVSNKLDGHLKNNTQYRDISSTQSAGASRGGASNGDASSGAASGAGRGTLSSAANLSAYNAEKHTTKVVTTATHYGTLKLAEGTAKSWIDQLTEAVDAAGTNDQLAMIHIKQLNDNINNSSSMVSGIIESRNNATSSIINNIA